jgi:hypothetical protein
MPKAVLGTFGVVAGEELKLEIKISRWGVLFASVACCGPLATGHSPHAPFTSFINRHHHRHY